MKTERRVRVVVRVVVRGRVGLLFFGKLLQSLHTAQSFLMHKLTGLTIRWSLGFGAVTSNGAPASLVAPVGSVLQPQFVPPLLFGSIPERG